MSAPNSPNTLDYARVGTPFHFLVGKTSSATVNYAREGEPYPGVATAGTPGASAQLSATASLTAVVLSSKPVATAALTTSQGVSASASLSATASMASAGTGSNINGFYSTTFPLTEAPMSENGAWVQGNVTGLDWANVNTGGGIAYGTQAGTSNTPPTEYDDSTAVLTGTWTDDQYAEGTFTGVGSYGTSSTEVEIRLRTAISAHTITGIECELGINTSGAFGPYADLVRWNGALGDFTGIGSHLDASALNALLGRNPQNGDKLRAQVVGNTVTVWINNVQIYNVTDSRWGTLPHGTPGVGVFYDQRDTIVDKTTYGFTTFLAESLDGSSTPSASAGLTTHQAVAAGATANDAATLTARDAVSAKATLAATASMAISTGPIGTASLQATASMLPIAGIATLPGLVCWLNADTLAGSNGTAIGTWTDQSTAGNSATQATGGNQPVLRTGGNGIGGHQALDFTGTKFMTTPAFLTSGFNQAITTFVVFKRNSGTNNYIFDVNNNQWSMTAVGADTTNNLEMNFGTYASVQAQAAVTPAGSGNTPPILLEPVVASFRYNGSRFRISVNGEENGEMPTDDNTSGGNQNLAGQAVTLGERVDGFGTWQGLIAEFVVCNSVLSDAAKKGIELLLRQKYSITPSKIVYCDGDSLTAGFAVTQPNSYPAQMAPLLPFSYSAYDMGHSGDATQDLLNRVQAQTDAYWIPDRPSNTYVPWIGTNDISFGFTNSSIETNLITIWTGRKAVGFKVFACTIIPRGTFNGTQETQRQALNAWIVANWSTYCDGLIDFTTNAAFNSSTSYTNTTYYNADQTHLTNTGYGVIAQMVAAVLGGVPAAASDSASLSVIPGVGASAALSASASLSAQQGTSAALVATATLATHQGVAASASLSAITTLATTQRVAASASLSANTGLSVVPGVASAATCAATAAIAVSVAVGARSTLSSASSLAAATGFSASLAATAILMVVPGVAARALLSAATFAQATTVFAAVLSATASMTTQVKIQTTVALSATALAYNFLPDFSTLPGLALWLEASTTYVPDGSAVGTWRDLSGNSHSATQATGGNQPIMRANGISGRPALDFSSSKSMQTPTFLTTGYNNAITAYVVFQRSSGTGDAFVFDVNVGQFSLDNAGVTPVTNLVVNAQTPPEEKGTIFGAVIPNETAEPVLIEPVEVSMRFDGSHYNISINGEQNSQFQYPTGDTVSGNLSLNGTRFTFGQRQDGAFTWSGKIAEFIVCNAVHTDAVRKQTEQQLRQKYNIPTPPVVYADGDSLTAGTGSSGTGAGQGPWPLQLINSRAHPFFAYNNGVAGYLTTDVLARVQNLVDPFFIADRRWPYYVIWIGTNDVDSSSPEATIEANIQTLWTGRASLGFKVVACTIIPRGSFFGTGKETARTDINSWIRANWQNYCSALADFANDPVFSSPTAYTNTTYYSTDQTHLTNTGYSVIAGIVSNALNLATAFQTSFAATTGVTTGVVVSAAATTNATASIATAQAVSASASLSATATLAPATSVAAAATTSAVALINVRAISPVQSPLSDATSLVATVGVVVTPAAQADTASLTATSAVATTSSVADSVALVARGAVASTPGVAASVALATTQTVATSVALAATASLVAIPSGTVAGSAAPADTTSLSATGAVSASAALQASAALVPQVALVESAALSASSVLAATGSVAVQVQLVATTSLQAIGSGLGVVLMAATAALVTTVRVAASASLVATTGLVAQPIATATALLQAMAVMAVFAGSAGSAALVAATSLSVQVAVSVQVALVATTVMGLALPGLAALSASVALATTTGVAVSAALSAIAGVIASTGVIAQAALVSTTSASGKTGYVALCVSTGGLQAAVAVDASAVLVSTAGVGSTTPGTPSILSAEASMLASARFDLWHGSLRAFSGR